MAGINNQAQGAAPRRQWLSWVRVALGLLLLGWVFKKMPTDEFRHLWAESVYLWPWWIAGFLFTLLGLVAAAFRWYWLLSAQGVNLPATRVFRIFFIGQFFNAFFPGSCGGDAVRVYYIFKDTTLKRTEAMSTVVVDRGVGLLTIVAVACAMMAWRLPQLIQERWATIIGSLLLLVLLGTGIALYLMFRRHLFHAHDWAKRLESGWMLGPILRRVYNAFYVYREHPRTLFGAALLSFINLVGLTFACFAFGQSLKISVSLADYFTLFPVITVLSAIPLTPGALGVRESLFAELFVRIGTSTAAAVSLSLLVYIGGLVWSLVGGLMFLSYSSRHGTSFRAEWQRLKAEHKQAPSPAAET